MPQPTFMGITVVPMLDATGAPCARIHIDGTTADQITAVDAEGAEIAISYEDGQFHIADFRGADAVSG